MKKKTFFLLFSFLFLISAIGFYIFYKIIPKTNLHETILQALLGAKGEYSVVVKDLKNGKKESFNGNKVYEIASLYKLWVMAEVFREIQNGTLSKKETLSEDISVLNKDFNISSESAELAEGTIILTVGEALKQMITISHNYSALLLTKRIGISNVNKFLRKNGFLNSHIGGTPTATADDIALFFEKLYKNKLANAKYTQEMLDLLKAQKLNGKLPKYLPKGTIIAHKTGEINYLSHDAGIIYTKNKDYIIVVLSKSNYPPGAVERIAQISKAVFDYFLTKN